MATTDQPTVRVGQVWQSNDPREAPGRKVRVWHVGGNYVHVRALAKDGGWNGRGSRILLSAFRCDSARTGYRLIEDVTP